MRLMRNGRRRGERRRSFPMPPVLRWRNRSSRGCAVTIRCFASPFQRHKREVRTLRIDALRDPRTTWYLHRPVQHLAFALGDAPERGIERSDVEIIPPRRNRDVWRLRHHPALVLAVDGEELIGAHRPHVDRRRFRPAEELGIELERRLEIARVEFMPTNVPWRARRRGRIRVLTHRREEKE